jgi:hypothetical protein
VGVVVVVVVVSVVVVVVVVGVGVVVVGVVVVVESYGASELSPSVGSRGLGRDVRAVLAMAVRTMAIRSLVGG